jgi:hypothetical protein
MDFSNKQFTTKEMFFEYVRCAEDIEYFLETYVKVWDKGGQKEVPFRVFPHQSRVLDGYLNHEKVVILKYRQGGITTITCGYICWLINFTPKIKVAVVANQLQLARDSIFATIVSMMKSLPDWLQNKVTGKDTQILKEFENKASLKAFAAGKNGIRGFSPDLLFIDEAAYLEHGNQFFTAAVGSLSAGGRIILNSTPHGMDEVYYATIDGAKNRKNTYHVVEIYWYGDPRFNKGLKWINAKDTTDVIACEDPARFEELISAGYKPTSPWYENACADYNYDPKKIAQELNCVGGATEVTIRDKETGEVITLKIKDLYKMLSKRK